MPAKRAILELSPSRLELSVIRGGKVTSSRALRFPRTEWPQNFAETLREMQDALGKMVLELGCPKAHTTLIYRAPGTIANVTSCPASAGLGSAEQAARLAIANVTDFVLDGSPSDTMLLLTDKEEASSLTSVAQAHILAAAEAELRAASLTDWVRSADLHVERLIPAEAVDLARSVKLVTRPEVQSLSALLWLGEHSAVLAVGSAGKLVFVRSVSTGLESLVEALTRPMRPKDSSEVVTLTRDQARTLLRGVGIPHPEQLLPDYPALAGSSLLPHLQPVLQRLSVEVKQSLRFGIPEAQRGTVTLSIAGPASVLPNLAAVLARQAGVPAAPALLADSPFDPACDVVDARDATTINLLPEILRFAATSRRLRGALMAGAALTIATMAADFGVNQFSLRQETRRLESLEAQRLSASRSAASRESSIAARNALTALEQRVRSRLTDAPDPASALALLADQTPPSMRLTDISLASEAALPILSLRGFIRYADAPDPAGIINRYITTLSGAPVIAAARLGTTVRAPVRGSDALSFEIRIELVPVPPPPSAAFVAADREAR